MEVFSFYLSELFTVYCGQEHFKDNCEDSTFMTLLGKYFKFNAFNMQSKSSRSHTEIKHPMTYFGKIFCNKIRFSHITLNHYYEKIEELEISTCH